ncbi:hypothetical protein KEJ33_05855 [Candidatus Bathyarchaeota archaeon]|nr:hypothetical protein [Candidatus Bathyarchaeota archaeon]
MDFLIKMANSGITISCGIYLAIAIYKGRLEKSLFYYAWSAGFILYALEIMLQPISTEAMHIVGSLAYLFIAIGVWRLSGKRELYVILVVIFFLLFGYLFSLLSIETEILLIYAIITLGIVRLRFLFGKAAETLVLGWIFLCLTNIFLLESEWIPDIFAIVSKIAIISGIVSTDFAMLPKRLDAFLSSKSLPIDTELSKNTGKLTLATLSPASSSSANIKWIQRQIRDALSTGTDTYLFLIEKLPPLGELRRLVWMKPEKVHVLIFSSSAGEIKKEFMVLDADLQAIGAAFHEVLKLSASRKQECSIVIDSISTMVQLFGGAQTYRLFLQKMGVLRESMASVYGLFHPELHEPNVTAMFQDLSDSRITIE